MYKKSRKSSEYGRTCGRKDGQTGQILIDTYPRSWGPIKPINDIPAKFSSCVKNIFCHDFLSANAKYCKTQCINPNANQSPSLSLTPVSHSYNSSRRYAQPEKKS